MSKALERFRVYIGSYNPASEGCNKALQGSRRAFAPGFARFLEELSFWARRIRPSERLCRVSQDCCARTHSPQLSAKHHKTMNPDSFGL